MSQEYENERGEIEKSDDEESEIELENEEKDEEKEEYDNSLDFSDKNTKYRICPVFGLLLTENDLLQDGHPLLLSLISSYDDMMKYTYTISSEELHKLGVLKINSINMTKSEYDFIMEFHQSRGKNFKFPIPGHYVFKKRINLTKNVKKHLKRSLQDYEQSEQAEFVSFSTLN